MCTLFVSDKRLKLNIEDAHSLALNNARLYLTYFKFCNQFLKTLLKVPQVKVCILIFDKSKLVNIVSSN